MSNPIKDGRIRRKKKREEKFKEHRNESEKWQKFTVEIEVDEMVGAEWCYATQNKVKKWMADRLKQLPMVNNVHIKTEVQDNE